MGKIYNNPPVREAICEIRFALQTELSPEHISAFYAQVSDIFPTQAKGQSIFINSGPREDNPNEIAVEHKIEQFDRFLNEQNKYSAHLTKNGVVSIHKIEPYNSWEEYFPLIQRAYTSFFDIAEIKEVERLGLRYVNEINLPIEDFSIQRYFNYDLRFPIEDNLITQQLNLTFDTNGGKDIMNVKISDISLPNQNAKKFYLDLDYYTKKNSNQSLDAILPWIDSAHQSIEDYFQSLISLETKALFD